MKRIQIAAFAFALVLTLGAAPAFADCGACGLGDKPAPMADGQAYMENPKPDCPGCAAAMDFGRKLAALGAKVDIGKSKQGMISTWYVDDAANVRQVRALVKEMASLDMSRMKGLCNMCSDYASATTGKTVTREVVNTQHGAVYLITATSAAEVKKIHEVCDMELAQQKMAAHSESG
jgi:hypothetical protein